ncbi:hypothetical protein ES703_13513 [subsurface metagenome]
MEVLTKIWKWIDHNRYIVTSPIIMLVIWIIAVGCLPETASPTMPGKLVNVNELRLEYETFMLKFEYAVKDIEGQTERQDNFIAMIIKLASGNVADLPGLLQLLLGGGFFGAVTDNIRKRTVIATLKRKTA